MIDSENKNEVGVEERSTGLSRRSFFERASLVSTATALGLFGLAGTVRAFADQPNATANATSERSPRLHHPLSCEARTRTILRTDRSTPWR